MIATIPACRVEDWKHPYGDALTLSVTAFADRFDGVGSGVAWDPHLRVEILPDLTVTLTLAQSEMLETALRVARQSVRPRR